jgi:hypothetical protein
MISGDKNTTVSKRTSFNEVVDEACDRLMEQQVRYSIGRIEKLGEMLDSLERELDEFLSQK